MKRLIGISRYRTAYSGNHAGRILVQLNHLPPIKVLWPEEVENSFEGTSLLPSPSVRNIFKWQPKRELSLQVKTLSPPEWGPLRILPTALFSVQPNTWNPGLFQKWESPHHFQKMIKIHSQMSSEQCTDLKECGLWRLTIFFNGFTFLSWGLNFLIYMIMIIFSW